MKRFYCLLFALIAAFAVAGLAPVEVGASTLNPICSELDEKQKEAAGCKAEETDLTSRVPMVVNVVMWIAGTLAVVMIVYSGVQMILSTGDSTKAVNARKTLTYAVVGLVIVILAYVIVNFVVGQIGGGGEENSQRKEQVEEQVA